MFSDLTGNIYNGLSAMLLILLVALLLTVLVMFVADMAQTRNAVRRNYPVIGRFRALFEHLGIFFRQYFFAMDREEMPFNRAFRDWVYRAARNQD
ncbi:MAG: FMN-binding glutamate synthase family protein, partial [Mariprofundus sp.]